MGSRGQSSGITRYGGGEGGGIPLEITSLVSARETKQQEVDETLGVFKDVQDKYGAIIDDIQLVKLESKYNGTLAYYDGSNIAVNTTYFNKKAMDAVYKETVKSGFHPSNGNKTGLEAVVAHELGHKLTDEVAKKMGKGYGDIDRVSTTIVNEAKKATNHRGVVQLASKISTYATHSNAEAIAEAFSDVYCNGSKAHSESKAIMSVVDKYLK